MSVQDKPASAWAVTKAHMIICCFKSREAAAQYFRDRPFRTGMQIDKSEPLLHDGTRWNIWGIGKAVYPEIFRQLNLTMPTAGVVSAIKLLEDQGYRVEKI